MPFLTTLSSKQHCRQSSFVILSGAKNLCNFWQRRKCMLRRSFSWNSSLLLCLCSGNSRSAFDPCRSVAKNHFPRPTASTSSLPKSQLMQRCVHSRWPNTFPHRGHFQSVSHHPAARYTPIQPSKIAKSAASPSFSFPIKAPTSTKLTNSTTTRFRRNT